MSRVSRISSSIMKRTIKQRWSTRSPVWTKRTTSPHFKSHTHTLMTIRLLWVVACLLWVVRQEFPFKFIILFPLRQLKHPSTDTSLNYIFPFSLQDCLSHDIYLLKHCLLIQVRRVTMATYQVISHNEKRTELWLRQT